MTEQAGEGSRVSWYRMKACIIETIIADCARDPTPFCRQNSIRMTFHDVARDFASLKKLNRN